MAVRLSNESLERLLKIVEDPNKRVSIGARIALAIALRELKEQRQWVPSI